MIMIPSLRKRHRRVWLVLAIAMPLLFVAAVMVVPQPVYQDKLYQPAATTEEAATKPAPVNHQKDNQQ